MLTFSAMPRKLNTMHEGDIRFPRPVEMRATLGPKWIFGIAGEESERRLVVANSTGASVLFNVNTGRYYVRGGTAPPSINVSVPMQSDEDRVVLNGNVAKYEFMATSYNDIAGVGDALAYALPAALNAYLQVPPFVERIAAHCDGVERGYEVWALNFRVEIVSSDDQNQRAGRALKILPMFAETELRRFQAGLLYLQRAARLSEAGQTRWEFLSEAVLNLAKSLESLFAPNAESQNREPVRTGLRKIGLDDQTIEAWFIPALVLRNELDVAHVRLALLGRNEVPILAQYAEGAIPHFRLLFARLAEGIARGESVLDEYEDRSGSERTKRLLDRIKAQMEEVSPKSA
jgi:hypothetical protein